MIPMTLGRIASVTGGVLHDADARPVDLAARDAESPDLVAHPVADLVVDGPVVTDSREAGPGGLYVARIGEHADGHTYIPAAIEADPHLGGVLTAGYAEINEIEAAWVTIGGIEYRVLDFYSTVIEK